MTDETTNDATEAPPPEAPAEKPPQAQAKTEPPKALLDEIKGLRQERADLRAKVEELSKSLETTGQLQAQLDVARRDLQLAGVGLVDPEGVAVAEAIYERQPKDDRPPMPEWLKSAVDSGNIPRALRAYLPNASSDAGAVSSAGVEASRGLSSTPQPAPGTVAEQAPPAPTDAKGRLQAATEKLQSLRRIGGTPAEMQDARAELQQALTALRR